MIDLDNQTNLSFSLSSLEDIASILTQKSIELILVTNSTIQAINEQYRQKNTATDVLSFPLDMSFLIEDIPLGSIVISIDFVKQKAQELQHSIQDELSLLFIHGLLHLLGFDHEVDSGEMRQKEEEIIRQFHLPTSLIIRT